ARRPEVIGHLEASEATYSCGETTNLSRILRCLLQELSLHPAQIGIDAQLFATLALHANVLLRIYEAELSDVKHFLPSRVQWRVGLGAQQPVQAGLKPVVT